MHDNSTKPKTKPKTKTKTKPKTKTKTKPKLKPKYKCEFCPIVLKTESGLVRHKCDKKQRWLNRDNKETRIAVEVWKMFREMIRVPIKKGASYEVEFVKSREYNDFYNFATYIIQTKPINHLEYAKRLIRNEVPSAHWCSDTLYKDWTIEYMKNESPDQAMERTLNNIIQWADSTGNDWQNFFQDASSSRILDMMERGRLSPWFFYIRGGAESFISRCSDDELRIINDFIDPDVWIPNLERFDSDVQDIKSIFRGI